MDEKSLSKIRKKLESSSLQIDWVADDLISCTQKPDIKRVFLQEALLSFFLSLLGCLLTGIIISPIIYYMRASWLFSYSKSSALPNSSLNSLAEENTIMKKNVSIVAIMIAGLLFMSLQSVYAGDEYGYIGDEVVKEIYESYDQLEVLGDEYLPLSVWENQDLEKGCLKDLSVTYSDEKNAPAKIKVLKVYLNYPQWISYTKVSSDANDGTPTYRRTFCIYILQKDTDKFMIVWSKQVYENCTNYDRNTLKPISYSTPSVTTLSSADWEDWGKVTAFKLTREQVVNLGLIPGTVTKPVTKTNREKLNVSLEYTPGYPAKATIQAKNSTGYLVLWENGDFLCLTNAEFKKAQNSTPATASLKVGAKVSAQWTNGSFYDGTIVKIKGSAYTIEWDDGSDPIDVTINQIRLK